jgi:diphthamide biosynthesis methyltransferase
MVESASDEILDDAQNVDVAFLVVGDPFGYVFLDTPQGHVGC